jgi:hypothetical protein
MEKKARELSETKQDLEKSQTEEATQRARADKASTELAKTQKERNESREELARWLALGVKPEEINGLKADLKKAKEDIEVAEVDKKSLSHRIDGLESRLHRYEGDTAPPIEMPGLRGSRCFEILGFDIMIDSKLRPWLIEVNHLPSFGTDSPLDLDIKARLMAQVRDASPIRSDAAPQLLYSCCVRLLTFLSSVLVPPR